jgi:hypothetical protein
MKFDRIVMPALVAGIHVLNAAPDKDVDGRNKSGHDELRCISMHLALVGAQDG